MADVEWDQAFKLSDALRTFSDPSLWAAYEEALERAKAPPRGSFETGEEELADARDRRPWHIRATKLRLQVEHAIREKLTRGELVASGYFLPIGPNSTREVIRGELFGLVRIRWPISIVDGSGIKVVQIRVLHSDAFTRSTDVGAKAGADQAETLCGEWLSAEAARGEPWKKMEAFDAAYKRFPGLGWRAFERAWSEHAAAAWKRPGRRRRKSSH